jgi:hypothetical protein
MVKKKAMVNQRTERSNQNMLMIKTSVVPQDPKESLDLVDQQAHKDQLEYTEPLDHKDNKEPLDLTEKLEQEAH